MKKLQSRKFIGAVIASSLLTIVYFTTLIIQKIIDAKITILYMILIVTLWIMYVGGNIWNTWVKSKYFISELNEAVDE